MPLGRAISKGLVYTIDLSKIADRENPRTVEAPILTSGNYPEPMIIEWGDGTVEMKTSGAWPTHEYATEGVYTVILRSSSGQLPHTSFSGDTTSTPSNPNFQTHSLTPALISLDHFAGVCAANGFSLLNNLRNTENASYIDPRYIGQAHNISLSNMATRSGIAQPLESISLEFCTRSATISGIFNNCTKAVGSIPALHDGITSAPSAFYACYNLDGYICEKLPPGLTAASYMFSGCEKLKGNFPDIPDTLTGDARGMFYHCYELEGPLPDIPDGVTSIREMFSGDKGATAFPESFPATLTDVRDTFGNCSGLSVSTISAPELWDTANYPNITEHTRCFFNLPDLANYADIPADWK